MKPFAKTTLTVAAVAAVALAAPAAAFDLDSDTPITVSADNARLDDGRGIATYTGQVELSQGATRLSAERVVLYRDENGLSRIEASGSPARYRQPTRNGDGETDASAQNITWAAENRQLIFERNAIIKQNGNQFSGDVIHYDTVQRVVTAEGGQNNGSGRVEMIIQPRTTTQGSDGSSQSQ